MKRLFKGFAVFMLLITVTSSIIFTACDDDEKNNDNGDDTPPSGFTPSDGTTIPEGGINLPDQPL